MKRWQHGRFRPPAVVIGCDFRGEFSLLFDHTQKVVAISACSRHTTKAKQNNSRWRLQMLIEWSNVINAKRINVVLAPPMLLNVMEFEALGLWWSMPPTVVPGPRPNEQIPWMIPRNAAPTGWACSGSGLVCEFMIYFCARHGDIYIGNMQCILYTDIYIYIYTYILKT